MRIEQMQHFMAVCEEKNFGRAAGKLHMAQQTLSNSIKNLERALGDELLIRDHKGIERTYKGDIAYRYFQEILALYDRLMDEMNSADDELGREVLVISVICGAIQNIAPEFQGEMFLRHPRVQLDIRQDELAQIIAQIEDQSVDLGLIHILSAGKGAAYPDLSTRPIQIVPIYHWRPYVWLGSQNALSRKGSITIENVKKYPILIYSQSDPALMQKFLELTLGAEAQVRPCDNLKTVAKLVESTSFLFFDWFSESYGLNCQLFFAERAVKAIPVVQKQPVGLDTVAIYHKERQDDGLIQEAVRILFQAAKS